VTLEPSIGSGGCYDTTLRHGSPESCTATDALHSKYMGCWNYQPIMLLYRPRGYSNRLANPGNLSTWLGEKRAVPEGKSVSGMR